MAVDLSGSFDRATLFESIFQMTTYHVQTIFGLLISEIRYSLNILFIGVSFWHLSVLLINEEDLLHP